jgi:DNA-binding protein
MPKKTEEQPQPEPAPRMTNEVFVGKKPVMAYITACITQINRTGGKVVLKARGRSISRAVDVAEVLRNRFATDLKIESIKTSTEKVQTEEGQMVNVSAIEIVLSK